MNGIATAALPFTKKPEGPLWYVISAWLVNLWGMCFFRLRGFGRDNIPAEGGVLIACSHQSFLDPLLVTGLTRRQAHVMARSSLFRNPLGSLIMRAYGAYPVKQNGLGLDALRTSIDLLRSGRAVILFPEGTRTRDGSIGPCQPGVIMAAKRAGVPVVPAVIDGAFHAWPRSIKWFSLREIRVIYGKPMDVTDMTKQEAALQLHESMLKLRQQLQIHTQDD